MPAFTHVLSVPANTPVETPVKEELEIEGDYLTRIEVYFPPGCCCLVGFQVRYGESALWPSRLDQYFRGHGYSIGQDKFWPIPERKAKLTLVAFNEDEKYPHNLYINVFTRWESEMEPKGLWARVLNALLAFFERVIGLRGGGRRG